MLRVSFPSLFFCISARIYMLSGHAERDTLDVSFQFLAAASGPVVTMKRRLHQGSHDASHRSLIAAPIALSIMLHSQPGTQSEISLVRITGAKAFAYFLF